MGTQKPTNVEAETLSLIRNNKVESVQEVEKNSNQNGKRDQVETDHVYHESKKSVH